MNHFEYRGNSLFAEGVSVAEIASTVGTPCYIYSRATIERHWQVFDNALASLDHLICYSVKANSNIALLNLLARLGSGFDIVSGGELERVMKAGGDVSKTVFSGVGKTDQEIQFALQSGIHCFNIESAAELTAINNVATRLDQVAPVSIRVNPDVDAHTHPYISTGLKENKFGVEIEYALPLFQQAAQMSHIKVIGLDCHIGSQLTDMSPFIDALQRLMLLIDDLKSNGIEIEHLDIGGGLGITYDNESPPSPAEYVKALLPLLENKKLKLLIEPGRAIVGNAGILATSVTYLKTNGEKHFAIVDSAMNDLLRPALYDAWQNIIPVEKRPQGELKNYDIVGPVCETADFLGKDRDLNIQQGDLLAVCSAGAYGFVMSSNYNSRPRAAEVMVDGDQMHIIRQRETIADLFKGESLLPDPG
jgi:diaminopimelate decarboxylase